MGSMKTHGMTHTRTYGIWCQLIQRVTNPNHKNHEHYLGRGITVCERWKAFENFLVDMGVRPDGMTLERIDNEKGYGPDNCRWATRAEQRRNQRNTRMLLFRGETKCAADWAIWLGIGLRTLTARLDRGWSIERALTAPMDNRGGLRKKPQAI
jgi:hypothetical protein